MAKRIIMGTFALAAAVAAYAQTVTVNSGGGADHTSLAAAITAVAGNAATPDIVNITGGGPYDELLPVLASSVEIRGTGASRPVLLLQRQASGNHGLIVSCDGDVVLDNLALLPSAVDRPTADCLTAATATAGGTLNLTLTDLLLTQNASGAPAVADPFVATDVSSATVFGDDAIVMSGSNGGVVHAVVDGCVVTHFSNTGARDGLTFVGNSTPGACTLAVSDTVVSYCTRFGFVLLGESANQLAGTADKPIFSYRNGYGGVSFDGSNVLEQVVVDMTGIASLEPYGWRADATTASSFSATKCAIVGSADRGFWFPFAALAPRAFSIAECTLYDNAVAISLDDTSTDGNLTINVADTVIAANAADAVDNYAVEIRGTAATLPAVNISTSAIVLSGPHALTGTSAPGSTGSPSLSGTITADPDLASTNIALSGGIDPDLFDVASPAYFAAGSGSSPLSGYGDYVGVAPSGVVNWTGYR